MITFADICSRMGISIEEGRRIAKSKDGFRISIDIPEQVLRDGKIYNLNALIKAMEEVEKYLDPRGNCKEGCIIRSPHSYCLTEADKPSSGVYYWVDKDGSTHRARLSSAKAKEIFKTMYHVRMEL